MNFSGIKQARKAAGMTQEDLASALGVNRATISKYENGNIPLTLQQLGKIAKILHTTVYEMIGNDWNGIDTNDAFETEMVPFPHEKQTASVKSRDKADVRSVEEILEQAREQLMNQEGLMFDGGVATDEAIESILAAMKIGLELAKTKTQAEKERAAREKAAILAEAEAMED